MSTLNGLGNQQLGGVASRAADPRFLRVVRLMGSLQESSAVGFRFAEGKQPATRTILFFRRTELTDRERQEIDEVRQLLHLDPEATEFDLVFGPTPASHLEIAMQTRSLVHIGIGVRSRRGRWRCEPGSGSPSSMF